MCYGRSAVIELRLLDAFTRFEIHRETVRLLVSALSIAELTGIVSAHRHRPTCVQYVF